MKNLNIILQSICYKFSKILQNQLIGIYIHGSIALNDFTWDSSDIDFITVVNSDLQLYEKKEIINHLLTLLPSCPPKGLEMSIVLDKHCRCFTYPPPYILHFSKKYYSMAQQDLESFCNHMYGYDKDLATHFFCVRQKGIAIYGEKNIQTIFSPVPISCYLDSIINDIEDSMKNISLDPFSTVANLCRSLYFCSNYEIISKTEGLKWANQYLPTRYRSMASNILNSNYDLDDSIFKEFYVYTMHIIRSHLNKCL